jgi:hypothetical protein
MSTAVQRTCFLIADISGYTGYLANVELDHAQDILADFIGSEIGEAYGDALRSSVPSLKAQLRRANRTVLAVIMMVSAPLLNQWPSCCPLLSPPTLRPKSSIECPVGRLS